MNALPLSQLRGSQHMPGKLQKGLSIHPFNSRANRHQELLVSRRV